MLLQKNLGGYFINRLHRSYFISTITLNEKFKNIIWYSGIHFICKNIDTYCEAALQRCSKADLGRRLRCLLYKNIKAVITVSLFCATIFSICGKGPHFTSFVLHSSSLRKALSVNDAGAKLMGYHKIEINLSQFFSSKYTKMIKAGTWLK